jgi:hypothetical protein
MTATTARAAARTLPEATNADRRNIMRTFLALTGAVATSTVWNVGKTRAEETPNDGELLSLGQRLETLTREREIAQSLRVEARARFEKIAPKGMPMEDIPDTSIARVWDILIDPPSSLDHPVSMEQHWQIVRHLFDTENELPFATIKAAAERSGYAVAAERIRSIDVEIHALTSRALEIQSATLAGARAQALALLALDQTRYGRRWSTIPHEGVMTLSRAVVALSDGVGARA